MKRVIVAFLFAALLWVASPVQAATTVGPDKTWTITFNTAIDLQSADEAITVTNESGDEIDVDVWHQDDQKKHMKVKPSDNATYPEGTYTLTVSKQVKSVAGVQAETEATKTFTVTANGWGEWTSVKAMDMKQPSGEIVTVHLLADQPLPQPSSSSKWSDNQVEVKFQFGIEEAGTKRVSDIPVTSADAVRFYQNEAVDVDWQVRKLDERVFVVTQMEDERFTNDYYYGVKDGEIHPIETHSVEQGVVTKLYNDESKFVHQGGDRFIRRHYSYFIKDELKGEYVFNHEKMKFVEQEFLTVEEAKQKAEYLQDKVRNIVYGDLNESADDRSFERVEERLDDYVTASFSEEVRTVYNNACVDCSEGMFYNADWWWGFHTGIKENYRDRVIVETVVIETQETYGSLDWIVLKKEDDQWKLDGIISGFFQKGLHLNMDVEMAHEALINSDFAVTNSYAHVTSYEKQVTGYYNETYTATYHRFKDSGSGHVVDVDGSTGAIYHVE